MYPTYWKSTKESPGPEHVESYRGSGSQEKPQAEHRRRFRHNMKGSPSNIDVAFVR